MDPRSRFSSPRRGWVISRLSRFCPFVKVRIHRQRLVSQAPFLPQLLVFEALSPFVTRCQECTANSKEKIKWNRTRFVLVLRRQAGSAIIWRIHCPGINSPFRASQIPQPPLLCIWPWKMKFKPSRDSEIRRKLGISCRFMDPSDFTWRILSENMKQIRKFYTGLIGFS